MAAKKREPKDTQDQRWGNRDPKPLQGNGYERYQEEDGYEELTNVHQRCGGGRRIVRSMIRSE